MERGKQVTTNAPVFTDFRWVTFDVDEKSRTSDPRQSAVKNRISDKINFVINAQLRSVLRFMGLAKDRY
jgi:hypothetical protein